MSTVVPWPSGGCLLHEACQDPNLRGRPCFRERGRTQAGLSPALGKKRRDMGKWTSSPPTLGRAIRPITGARALLEPDAEF
jgi:hypothetical protein